MSEVYIVEKGWYKEGGDIESVHRTYQGALNAATALIEGDNPKNWKFDGVNEWSCFGEYIKIDTHNVVE